MLKYLIISISYFTISLHAQTDSVKVFILPEMKIILKGIDSASVYTFEKSANIISVYDSLLVSRQNYYSLNISDINKVYIKNGRSFWTGAKIGAAIGFLAGFIFLGDFNLEGGNRKFTLDQAVQAGIISAIPVGLIGGLIGLLIPHYDEFDIFKSKESKYKNLIRIFKKNRIRN